MALPQLDRDHRPLLFATSWLPSDPSESLARVPGGSTTGLDTGANLLQIAMRAARGAYLEAEPELTKAVISDCLRTIADGYSAGGPD